MLTAAPALCRPTDFSGLFPRAGPQQAAMGVAGTTQALPPVLVARTFEDLAGPRQRRQVLGDLLTSSNWLPDALPLHPDATNHPSAAGAAACGDRQLPASTTGEPCILRRPLLGGALAAPVAIKMQAWPHRRP